MSYATDGFEVFAPIYDAAALAGLKRAVQAACVRYRAGDEASRAAGVALADYTRSHPERNPGVQPEEVTDEPYMLGNLPGIDAAFRPFLAHPPLWQLAAELLGVPSAEVRYHYAQVVRKPARVGPALSWHRDYPNSYICPVASDFLRLVVSLEAVSAVNGGTGMVVGTHLITDEEARAEEELPHDGEGAVYPDITAGEVFALHPKVLHGGGPNRSDQDRDLLVVQFGAHGTAFRCTAPLEHLSPCRQEEMALSHEAR